MSNGSTPSAERVVSGQYSSRTQDCRETGMYPVVSKGTRGPQKGQAHGSEYRVCTQYSVLSGE